MPTNSVHARLRRIERENKREQVLVRMPGKRLLDMDNPLEKYNSVQFRQRYHILKETAVFITSLIENNLRAPTRHGVNIPPILQFLIAQRYFCTNSFQIVIGDLAGSNGLSQPSVSRLVKRVATAIGKLRPMFIKWPTEVEAKHNRVKFYEIEGFPGVVGCINGSQIQIKSPGGNDAELFRNRKQTFSINVQMVNDHNLNFINVVARWYGSAHDMRIFEHSNISEDLKDKKIPGLLLGDAGYACLPYLLTPYPSPNTPPQLRYNKAQLKTRNTAERAIGCWKRRFPILNYCRLMIPTCLTVIVATAVKHNVARQRNDIYEEENVNTIPTCETHKIQIFSLLDKYGTSTRT